MENNQKKESGGWDFLFIVIVIAAIVGNLKECSKDVTRSSDISISSWFSSKAYKMRWNGNMLVIEMPCPTYGIVGINEVGWGKVDVDDLLDDICDNAKKCDYSQCMVCAIFTYKSKDRYGNDIVEKSNLHYLVSINTSEARKYTSGRYLNESYNITGRIVSEALGVNN